MKLYLIRHGQTDWNIQGKIQGRQDISLNETGRQQARLLSGGMDQRPVTQIFSSRQKRAVETAAMIGARQKVDVDVIEGLEEVDFGSWEGLTMDQIREQFPAEYERWTLNPVEVAPPGGETLTDVYQRCKRVAEGIIAQAKGDLAIVSHGATLAHLMSWLLRDHPEAEEIIVENASITTIHYSPLTGDFTLLEANDTSHLQPS